jgi:YegS/Rv2252/BmrU family lipid kinase
MNPYAGTRKANRYLADILTLFNRADYRVITHMTAGPGDGTDIVASLAPEMDLVVCCGGDGTFNETVNGILRSGKDVPIGYIPAGSTNDFATSLQLSADPLKAAQAILDGNAFRYDIGLFGQRHFCYVASFGAFTKTSYATPQSIKNALGHTAYVLSGIQELSQLRNTHMRVELDDTVIEDDFLFGAVSNSLSVGGIVKFNDSVVKLNDGMFEVLLIKNPTSILQFQSIVDGILRKDLSRNGIEFFHAREITVTGGADVPWTLDGEYAEGKDVVKLINMSSAIHLVVPQQKKINKY